MEQQQTWLNEKMVPSLNSFITLRPERFGALLFNPYLGYEEELDPIDAYVVGLCNGHNTLGQIQVALGRRFGLSNRKITKRISQVLDRMTQCFAVVLKQGEQIGRIRLPDIPVFPEDGPYYCAPKSVIWDVTYVCNLACPHCLTSSGKKTAELNTKQAMSLIDELAKHKVLLLSLSGGEPFLRPDIVELLTHIASTNMRIDIATNGFELYEHIVRSVRDLPIFQVQVSIDGIGEQHDQFRGRKGAFERACRTVRQLREDGIAVSLSTTVTKENLDSLDRIINLAVELGCSGYKAIPFIPAGRGQNNALRLKLDSEGYHRLCRTMRDRRQSLKGQLNISTEASFDFLLGPHPQSSTANGSMGCSAGYDTLSIGADGTAYPCPFLHDFSLGNLLERPLRWIWRKSPMLKSLRTITKQDLSEPCRSCTYAPLQCRGGCRAAAYHEYGDLYAADPTCFMLPTQESVTEMTRSRQSSSSGPLAWAKP